jgi:glycosyltransferase involved in cell wall biosynthesis
MMNFDQIESDLLGICIPTYNRASYLNKCLSSITENFKKYGFTIYISDNCSEDNTEYIVNHSQQSYSNIVYIKNKSNIGPYLNILNVIEMAKSQYIWLMGDDDAILPNSIEKVLTKIFEGNDYIVVNAVPYDKNLERAKLDRVIDCNNNKKYGEGESKNLFVDLNKWQYHGFMSSMIIRRKLILPIFEKYREPSFPIYNSSWLPLAIFYETIAHKCGIFVCDPVVMNRDNARASEKNFWNYIFLDYLQVLEYLNSNGYFVNIRDLLKLTGVFFTATFSKYKNSDTTLFNEYVKKKKFFSYHLKLLIRFVDIIPKFLIDIFVDLINKFKQKP